MGYCHDSGLAGMVVVLRRNSTCILSTTSMQRVSLVLC